MIDGLIAGKVYGKPVERTGQSGKPSNVRRYRLAVTGSRMRRFEVDRGH